jgi:hypothetical protein
MFRAHQMLGAIVLLLTTANFAQVKVSVQSSQFSVEEQIVGKISNETSKVISYCIEFGQTSPHTGSLESTPSPFLVENHSDKGWNVLLIGPDVGSIRRSTALNPGASASFRFRLNNTGETRLSLYYSFGERKDSCHQSMRALKTAKSGVFVVR